VHTGGRALSRAASGAASRVDSRAVRSEVSRALSSVVSRVFRREDCGVPCWIACREVGQLVVGALSGEG
jgi:hypothetical protein